MATAQHQLNGVDVGRLNQTIEDLSAQPDLARFQFRARQHWFEGAHARTTIQDFYGAGREAAHARAFQLEAGEPDVLLGGDEGANATEAVLHALASCLSATFIYTAAARGVRIEALEVDLQGDLDLRGFLGISREVRRGFERIDVTFRVESDASDDQLQELIETAQRRSPVFDIVTNPTPVRVELERR